MFIRKDSEFFADGVSFGEIHMEANRDAPSLPNGKAGQGIVKGRSVDQDADAGHNAGIDRLGNPLIAIDISAKIISINDDLPHLQIHVKISEFLRLSTKSPSIPL